MRNRFIELVLKTWILMILISILGLINTNNEKLDEYIKQLEQNRIEQMEEKEVYMNKCKMYEDLLKVNGLLDECECR